MASQQNERPFSHLWCPEGDLNPHDRLRSADFKSAVSADKYFIFNEMIGLSDQLCNKMCKFGGEKEGERKAENQV